jgi:hypothetical protein
MTNHTSPGVPPSTFVPITNRPVSNVPADTAAVQAMLQAAINVENFTIPLYLSALSSIFGTHPIPDNATAAGRLWPGQVTTAEKGIEFTPNQLAYNTVFSVFIQEMLHLQLAANLATMFGVAPKFFQGTLLQNTSGGWGCFGPQNTVIPHIIDLTDTLTYTSVKVNLGALNATQLKLFLAIEQSHEAALADINPSALGKYFPSVPFAGWTAAQGEADLPLFGTIGWMYYCLLSYLVIEYADGQTLWQKMFATDNYSKQRDIFNTVSQGHPQAEYPGRPTLITATNPEQAPIAQALTMVEGICDQGEGNSDGLISLLRNFIVPVPATGDNVPLIFQPNEAALVADYDQADATARVAGDQVDHWERFNLLVGVVAKPSFLTFDQWFAQGKQWTADLLYTGPPPVSSSLPSPQQVADALNGLSGSALLQHLIVGAIAGINQALAGYWSGQITQFPFPAMQASGDRMTLYWAVNGSAPDLSAAPPQPSGDDAHACQGLSLLNPGNDCASLAVYHTCGGSNSCKGQGGCGYPNQLSGSTEFYAPSNNTCAGNGGCGAPISAWQEFGPPSGTMAVLNLSVSGNPPVTKNGTAVTEPFSAGGPSYATAWQVYLDVQGLPPGTPAPAPNNLRIVIPPN